MYEWMVYVIGKASGPRWAMSSYVFGESEVIHGFSTASTPISMLFMGQVYVILTSKQNRTPGTEGSSYLVV